MKVVAMKSFQGQPGEGTDGYVRARTMIDVAPERAQALAANGLVHPLEAAAPTPENKMAPAPSNKASVRVRRGRQT